MLVVAAAVLVVVGVVVFGGGGDSGSEDVAPTPTEPGSARGTRVDNASQAFAVAGRQLDEAGSFRYEGTAHAREANPLRPTVVFPTPVEVSGEVALPSRAHEVASDGGDTVHETIIVGSGFWERTKPVDGEAGDAPAYGDGQRGSFGMGATLLPVWLDQTTGRTIAGGTVAQSLGVDTDGDDSGDTDGGDSDGGDTDGGDSDLRLFGATLALDEVEGPPLQVYIALDGNDVLSHVWIGSADAPFSVDWEISAIGEELVVEAPGPLPDATVDITPGELVDAGIGQGAQLTEVPEGWVQTGAAIQPDWPRDGCSTLSLGYDDVDVPRELTPGEEIVALTLDVTSDDCAFSLPDTGPRTAIEVGDWTGDVVIADGTCDGTLTKDGTTVHFRTELDIDVITTLLTSLEPFDPDVGTTEIDSR